MTIKNYTGSLQEYYTEAQEINELMVSSLGDLQNKKLLEPAAGRGAFIEKMPLNCAIDAIDINPLSVSYIKERFGQNVTSQCGDFIDHYIGSTLLSNLKVANEYDAVICNPPYGLRFTLDYRKLLKRRLPGMYVRESYGLFVYLSVMALRDGGRFSFVIPDTFLSSKNHTSLRDFLAKNCNLESVYVFNSSRFETVNYGYGAMSILVGRRSDKGQIENCHFINAHDNNVSISDGKKITVTASDLRKTANVGWSEYVHENKSNFGEFVLLGELADCKTGIYTGDNTKYCAFLGDPKRKVNGVRICEKDVFNGLLCSKEKTEGLSNKLFVPLVRGGHWLPFEMQTNYIEWSVEAVEFYKTNAKSRFQNSSFYFREGIAVPMVTSGRITASYMNNAVFDQGVVGVFPKNPRDINVLLVVLNSPYATDQKLSINPSANNSANYLKRIKIPRITDDMRLDALSCVEKWRQADNLTRSDVERDCLRFFAKLPLEV